jgi:hypothetical protein
MVFREIAAAGSCRFASRHPETAAEIEATCRVLRASYRQMHCLDGGYGFCLIQDGLEQFGPCSGFATGRGNVHAPDASLAGFIAIESCHTDELSVVYRAEYEASFGSFAKLLRVAGDGALTMLGCSFAKGLRLRLEGFEAEPPQLWGVVVREAPDFHFL